MELELGQLVMAGNVFGDIVGIETYEDSQVFYDVEGQDLETEKSVKLIRLDAGDITVI